MHAEKIKKVMYGYELAVRINKHLIKNNKIKLRQALVNWLLPIVKIKRWQLTNLIDKDLKCREKDINKGYGNFEERLEYFLTTNDEFYIVTTDISDAELHIANLRDAELVEY